MAVEAQVGVAKIFGLGAAAMVTLTGAAYLTIEDADLVHDFDVQELTGQDGNVETMIAFKERYDITINFAPKGNIAATNTRAQAITSILNSKPAPLTKVVLSGFDVAAFNGDYNYVGGWNPKLTKEGVVVSGIKLRAHIANRVSLTSAALG